MKVFREPLLHFLLLGAGLFAAFALLGRQREPHPGEIVVTRGQLAHLAGGFERFHRRPPSPDEMQGLIREYVREEVACREAIELGLDRGDPVIRQRLRQKMELISDDVGAMVEPTDEQLRAYLREHGEAFRVERRFTFSHAYLDPQRRRDTLSRDTAQLLEQLQRAGGAVDVSMLGDAFVLEHEFEALSASEVGKLFGDRFAAALRELPPGQWQGPIESGYGVHLVYVRERTEERFPALEEVRHWVRREWSNVQRQEAREQFYAALLERYTVSVEPPEPSGQANGLAAAAPR
jgi:hypothetical protein